MADFIYPNFWSVSEFSRAHDGDRRNGDCGWAALLPLLHCLNPTKYPLTADALDLLVEDANARGCLMAPNGMTNIPNLDKYLNDIGIPHKTIGYADFNFARFHADLLAMGNPTPGPALLVEWSTAGKGLPDDEPAVMFHFSTFGGIRAQAGSGGGYFRADGDSNTDNPTGAPTPPILTGITEIANATPIGYILISLPLKGNPIMWTNITPQGKPSQARDTHGAVLTYGQADFVIANPTTADAKVGEPTMYFPDGNTCVTALEDDTVLWWDKTRNTTLHVTGVDGQLASELMADCTARDATIAALQAQLKNPPAPPITPAQQEEMALGAEVEKIDAILTTSTAS